MADSCWYLAENNNFCKAIILQLKQINKKIWHHDHVDFIPIRQGEVNIQKSINMTQYINRKKNRIILLQKKTIWQKFDNLSRWNTQQTTNNKLYQHQHKKCHYEKSTAMGIEWKLFLWGQEGKDAHSAPHFNKALTPLEQSDEKRKSKVPRLRKKEMYLLSHMTMFHR